MFTAGCGIPSTKKKKSKRKRRLRASCDRILKHDGTATVLTRQVIPKRVPNEDFIFDYFGHATLDLLEFDGVYFIAEKSSAESASEQRTAFFLVLLPELRCAGVMPVVDVR